jgi:hypothetical protein
MNRRQRRLSERIYQKQRRQVIKEMTHIEVPTEQQIMEYIYKKAGIEEIKEEPEGFIPDIIPPVYTAL